MWICSEWFEINVNFVIFNTIMFYINKKWFFSWCDLRCIQSDSKQEKQISRKDGIHLDDSESHWSAGSEVIRIESSWSKIKTIIMVFKLIFSYSYFKLNLKVSHDFPDNFPNCPIFRNVEKKHSLHAISDVLKHSGSPSDVRSSNKDTPPLQNTPIISNM